MERVDQCEGFEVLQARGKGSRWSVYRDSRGALCGTCGAKITTYRIEHTAGVDGTIFYSRIVCPTHVLGVTVPRVTGTDIEGVPAPRPGSPGAARMADLAARLGALFLVLLALSLTACTDHHTVVCAEGRDESVCFDDAELATVVALNDCIDTRAIPAATAPTYEDLVLACAARAIATHTPSSPIELWRKLVVVYSHADDIPEADDDLNRALHYLCTRARLEHCERYDEAMAFAGAGPSSTTFAAGGAA